MKKGYRDDHLFGDAITDPKEVAFFETRDLGNIDIPIYLLKHGGFNEEENNFLKDIIDNECDEIDKEFFQEIIGKYVGDRNFCKWLCNTPADVYYSYLAPMSGNDISLEEFEKGYVTEYNIPESAVVLADLGDEGRLYVWKE